MKLRISATVHTVIFHWNSKTEKLLIYIAQKISKFDSPTRDAFWRVTFQNFEEKKFWPEALEIQLYFPIWILQIQYVLRPLQ